MNEVLQRDGRSILDRFAERHFPGWFARREAARLQVTRNQFAADALEISRRSLHELRRGGYEGASKGPGQGEWLPGGGSADEDLLPDLEDLRNRARDLDRNDPHADGLSGAFCDAVVGTGLVPQPLIDAEALGITDAQARRFRRDAHRVFVEQWWPRADYADLHPFGELQRLMVYGLFMSGDGWAIFRPREMPGQYLSRIQIVEADQVMSPPGKELSDNIREGVEIDGYGGHAAYWIKKTHPGDWSHRGGGGYSLDDFVRVPRRDAEGRKAVCHLYRAKRPGQTRGAPALASALLYFRDLKQYIRAEIMAAKIAACFAVFVSTDDPQGLAAANAMGANRKDESLRPGTIKYLGLGDQVEMAKPGRNASDFATFVDTTLRSVGCGVRTPPEITGNDFSRTTYTSGRMAVMMARQVWAIWQHRVAAEFCQPAYERVLTEAFARGDLAAPGFLERLPLWTRARWKGPAQTWIDPQKEVDATLNSIAGNLSTLADECAARNLHWEDVLEQRAEEEKRKKELGIVDKDRPPAQQSGPEEQPRNPPRPQKGTQE